MAGIYKVITHFSCPAGPATINMHYQNITVSDSGKTPTDALADAFWEQIVLNEMKDLISTDTSITATRVYRVDNLPAGEPPGLRIENVAGIHSSESLPVNMGLKIDVVQSFFPRNRNGHFTVPGLPEEFVLGSVYNQLYAFNHVQPFLAAIGALVIETPDAGQWRLGVLSRKHLTDNPGDYVGAFADATGAGSPSVISGNRTRTTERWGVAV